MHEIKQLLLNLLKSMTEDAHKEQMIHFTLYYCPRHILNITHYNRGGIARLARLDSYRPGQEFRISSVIWRPPYSSPQSRVGFIKRKLYEHRKQFSRLHSQRYQLWRQRRVRRVSTCLSYDCAQKLKHLGEWYSTSELVQPEMSRAAYSLLPFHLADPESTR